MGIVSVTVYAQLKHLAFSVLMYLLLCKLILLFKTRYCCSLRFSIHEYVLEYFSACLIVSSPKTCRRVIT
jgi:hypothetical protein